MNTEIDKMSDEDLLMAAGEALRERKELEKGLVAKQAEIADLNTRVAAAANKYNDLAKALVRKNGFNVGVDNGAPRVTTRRNDAAWEKDLKALLEVAEDVVRSKEANDANPVFSRKDLRGELEIDTGLWQKSQDRDSMKKYGLAHYIKKSSGDKATTLWELASVDGTTKHKPTEPVKVRKR